jgi:reactive intermediate/imine deaminase
MRRLLAVLLFAVLPAVAVAQRPEFLNPNGQSANPFSSAVRVGNMLYLAGQLGTSGGALVSGGVQAETKQALSYIRDVLKKSGSDMDHVVQCTVFMADMKEWPAMNEVYRTFFKEGKFPARSAFGTTGLALSGRLEIECLAVVK